MRVRYASAIARATRRLRLGHNGSQVDPRKTGRVLSIAALRTVLPWLRVDSKTGPFLLARADTEGDTLPVAALVAERAQQQVLAVRC